MVPSRNGCLSSAVDDQSPLLSSLNYGFTFSRRGIGFVKEGECWCPSRNPAGAGRWVPISGPGHSLGVKLVSSGTGRRHAARAGDTRDPDG